MDYYLHRFLALDSIANPIKEEEQISYTGLKHARPLLDMCFMATKLWLLHVKAGALDNLPCCTLNAISFVGFSFLSCGCPICDCVCCALSKSPCRLVDNTRNAAELLRQFFGCG